MTKKKKPPRSKRKPADLRFKIRCCFIQGARMVSKKKGEGREKRRMERSLEEGKRSILRNSRRTSEFSLSNNGFRYIARSKKNEYRGRGSLG